MSTMKKAAGNLKKRAKNVPPNTDQLVRKVILAIDRAVVLATPVDTGRARANWQPSIGQPAEGTLPEPASPSAGRDQSDVRAVIAGYRPGLTVHITNNLPYIERLNNGSSSQAPADFVSFAILAVVRAVQRAKLATLTLTRD
ncbi:MAG: hypothetical protein DDT26_00035 [Dehalococcoidia bacterium]|nr:hypothetical protein [Chloroflexota bacterium]